MAKSLVRQIAGTVLVTDHLDYRRWLEAVYHELKHRNPNYTYSLLSADLGLGSSNAHMVVRGTRRLTEKSAQKIGDALRLPSLQLRYLLALVKNERAQTAGEREKAFEELYQLKSKVVTSDESRRQLDFFLDWYNAAILELLRLPEASDSPDWISQTLQPKVSVPMVKNSLTLLKELGFIAFDEERRRLFPTAATVTSGNEVRSLALAGFHRQMIELAKDALTGIVAAEREISSVTLAVPSHMRLEIKQEIIALRKRLIAKANEAENHDEVVQVNFQVFPLAKIGDKEPIDE